MALLNWEEEYSVGVRALDDQHKKLFNIINELHEQMTQGQDKAGRKDLLNKLEAYGEDHLKTEEELFDAYSYPEKEGHKKTHDAYRAKIREFKKGEEEHLLSFEIIDYLEDWWLGHITGVDRQYVDFFKGKKIS